MYTVRYQRPDLSSSQHPNAEAACDAVRENFRACKLYFVKGSDGDFWLCYLDEQELGAPGSNETAVVARIYKDPGIAG